MRTCVCVGPDGRDEHEEEPSRVKCGVRNILDAQDSEHVSRCLESTADHYHPTIRLPMNDPLS